MHGVKKEDFTEEKKQLIRKNIEIYKALSITVLKAKREKIYNEKILEKCDKMLSINAEHYTVWNYRKEIVSYLFENECKEASEQARILNNELAISNKTLKRNPKSYSSFYHRVWCINKDTFNTIDCKQELKLCSLFLQKDPRNFHVWDYRRFIVKKANIKLKDELEFTKQLVVQNFSNYSAWHYRSTLIPMICGDSKKKLKKRIKKEFEFVKNAFWTEPNDQSAWLYYRWLLGKDGYSSMIRLNPQKDHELMSNVHGYELDVDKELMREFTGIEQFVEAEEQSKWGWLTYCVLIHSLHVRQRYVEDAANKVNNAFNHLIKIDVIRKQYYLDVKDQLLDLLKKACT